MWITKNIVEAHHGKLTCHSEGLGKGCTMRLELPALMRGIDHSTGTSQDSSNCHEEDSLREADERSFVSLAELEQHVCPSACSELEEHQSVFSRALVVDDSPMCRKMVCRLLRDMSYECLEAKDGSDLINILTACNGTGVKSAEINESGQQPVDFILLDFEMPMMDGPTACKLLRERGYTLPVIGLTGNVMKADIDTFIDSGANAVILKPFSPTEFTEIMKKF